MKTLKKINKNQIMFLILFLFSFMIRCYKYGEIPGGVNPDEAFAAVDANALATYATDHNGMFLPVHLTAWGYGQMSSLLSYFMIPFIKLFGFNIITIRLPLLLCSMLGVLFLYLTVKKCFGVTAGLIATFFIAICPWHFIQSRWSLDCNLFPHLFIIGFYLLLNGIENRRHLYLSMVFFALCIYSYGTAVYTVPLFLGSFAIYLLISRNIKIKDMLICLLIFITISLPEFLTMVVNFFHLSSIETPFFTIPYFPDSVRSNDILILDFSRWQLWKNLKSMLKVAFLQTSDYPINSIDGFGPLYPISLVFILLGLVLLVRKITVQRKNSKNYLNVSILLFFLSGVWVGLITANVNSNRINIIFYALIILIALSISQLVKRIKPVGIATIILYSCISILFFQSYFTTYPLILTHYYSSDFVEALEYMDTLSADEVYITTLMEGYYNQPYSEIVTQFVLKIDSQFYQGQHTEEINHRDVYYYNYYHFYNSTELDSGQFTSSQSNTIYLIHKTEQDYFTLDYKEIETFGQFVLLTKGSN